MKMIAATYPPDWSLKETVALPVFTDQVPPRGVTGRIDFRLQGLISGLILERLFAKEDYWLLINPERTVAPELFLVPLGKSDSLSLDKVSNWFQRVCAKLAGAGARRYALAAEDLYRPEFGIKDFSGALIKSLARYPLEEIKLYANPELAEKLVQELGRWSYHFKTENPIELSVANIPDAFEVKKS